jgi:hypothetical protein
MKKDSSEQANLAKKVQERVDLFRETHNYLDGFRLAIVNAGDGDLEHQVADQLLIGNEEEFLLDNRLDVTLFADDYSVSNPVQSMFELTDKTNLYSSKLPQNFLAAQLSIQFRNNMDLFGERRGFHMGIIEGISTGTIEFSEDVFNREPIFDGLVTKLDLFHVDAPEGTDFFLSPITLPKNASHSSRNSNNLGSSHAKFLHAIARCFGQTGYPVVRVRVSKKDSDLINTLHDLSDWVITLDKRGGSSLYVSRTNSILNNYYLLDY